jgi:hypothetical protein
MKNTTDNLRAVACIRFVRRRVIAYGITMAITWSMMGADAAIHALNPNAGIGWLPLCVLGVIMSTVSFIAVCLQSPPNVKADSPANQ